MQRRQAILVFVLALVAGMLAVAIAGAPEEENAERAPPPVSRGDVEAEDVSVAFDAARPQTIRVPLGSQVEIEVEVPGPGQVELPAQGLNGAAEPGTPARFDVLAADVGRFEVRYVPVDGGRPRRAGTLVVE